MRSAILGFGAVLLLVGCGSGVDAEWVVDRNEARGALLGVWGTGSRDVWAAGGQTDRGLILHGDGEHWTEVEADADALIWNVYGFTADDVYAVGERGLVLHYDGETWVRVASGTDRNLYGIWGPGGDDVWAVGGEPGNAGAAVIVRRERSGAFVPVTTLPRGYVPDVFYKAYGTPYGLVVVGAGGTVLRSDGQTWTRDEVPTSRPIISLWGRGAELFAVGGFDAGVVLRFDGNGWDRMEVPGFTPGLNGVFTAPGAPVFAVGAQSSIVEISPEGSATRAQVPVSSSRTVLHGVWGDEAGTIYAVGGDLMSYPSPMNGVILRRP